MAARVCIPTAARTSDFGTRASDTVSSSTFKTSSFLLITGDVLEDVTAVVVDAEVEGLFPPLLVMASSSSASSNVPLFKTPPIKSPISSSSL
eukprot:CAMPEP_0201621422 /NCGR_PEP_ID=MMETSP0492-20130828/46801_1 /ASSEMBLY_ACC=CAM_ASM_000837 /TAXON_ID=420259 /ORGANISM="Thalassiosira gravida, Strain GMp14c1" /LENGTH=91 /DNA_ID=CAMNT_0048090943 /DNA_START=325 /DNA_END=600 /DNA_ORIENTATION=+